MEQESSVLQKDLDAKKKRQNDGQPKGEVLPGFEPGTSEEFEW